MTPFIIELNDSELRVAAAGKIIVRSPACAVVRGTDVCFGEAALRLAHLHPRETYNRFWKDLNQDALRMPTRRFRHHADFAYAHLLAVHEAAGKPSEVIFAVPGTFSNEQLALLLGIAQACPFKAVGLVDSAVASAAAVAGRGHYAHVAVTLHQSVVTRLDVDGQVRRVGVEVVDNGGLTAIRDDAAELLADTFIQQCRFDPFQHAETEQALYDELPGCLQELNENLEVSLAIKFRHSLYRATLGRDRVQERLGRYYAMVIQRLPGDRSALLADTVARLPGFIDSMAGGWVLEPEAVCKAIDEHGERIRAPGPALSFVTRLPSPSDYQVLQSQGWGDAYSSVDSRITSESRRMLRRPNG